MAKTLVVIGGGAAGFFCALTAARLNDGLRVIIAEKTGKLLSKVKISGGGRCNVTHSCFSIPEMIGKYPRGRHFLKKSFHRFFTTDTVSWFSERGVLLKTEEDGRMFPQTNTSQTIVDCLLKEAAQYGVDIRLHKEVRKIGAAGAGVPFKLHFLDGEILEADFICVASGGYPKSSMFEWLKLLGHSVEEPVPSLFTFNMPGHPITALMGISVAPAAIKIPATKLAEEGPVLITHWGLSGPAILRLSAWGARELAQNDYQFTVILNWLPAYQEQSMNDRLQQIRFELASQKIAHKNPFGLPQRLWEFLVAQVAVPETRWADLPAPAQRKLARLLCSGEYPVKGKTTFKEEFVTAGGIKTTEIDAGTMQSKIVPGLFFAGEVMDVDGITGGFNFQHAWTSGFIAGNSIAGFA
jgi:predicted Rossmann fold flavoprotein